MIAGHLQQKKGYWYIVLNLRDEQGRRKPKWIATHLPVGNNRRKAEELLFQARQRYADGREASGLLFADYMLQWLERVRFQVSPTTYHSYKYVIQRGICPYFRERNMTLAGLWPADLDEYYRYLCAQGLSLNTAIHHHANIHKALKDAVRLGLVERNVAELAERPRKTQYLPKYYSADEVDRLVRALQGHWLRLPVALSLFYGLRRSEVLGLQWRSVDFAAGTLHIQHTRVYQEADGKETAVGRDVLKRKSSCRTLPMAEPIKGLLEAEKARQSKGVSAPEGYVCLNRDGNPIAPNYFTQSFKRFLKKHGLREIRLHDLRHTCASLLIQSRVPLIEVQQWLGHSTLETTANLYAHLEYETKLNSAETLKKF